MTQVAQLEEVGSGRAAWLALRAQLVQQETQRRTAEDTRREEQNAALERFMDEQVAQAMNVDLTAPYGVGFARWIRRRYPVAHWAKLQAGSDAARCEFHLYLRAQGAFLAGEYDVWTRVSRIKPLRFSEPRAPRPACSRSAG